MRTCVMYPLSTLLPLIMGSVLVCLTGKQIATQHIWSACRHGDCKPRHCSDGKFCRSVEDWERIAALQWCDSSSNKQLEWVGQRERCPGMLIKTFFAMVVFCCWSPWWRNVPFVFNKIQSFLVTSNLRSLPCTKLWVMVKKSAVLLSRDHHTHTLTSFLSSSFHFVLRLSRAQTTNSQRRKASWYPLECLCHRHPQRHAEKEHRQPRHHQHGREVESASPKLGSCFLRKSKPSWSRSWSDVTALESLPPESMSATCSSDPAVLTKHPPRVVGQKEPRQH